MKNLSPTDRIVEQSFGKLSSGNEASLFTLTNKHGMQIKITNYGGIIVAIHTFDKTHRLSDIVLGYDRVSDYEQDTYYLGAIIGRYAGRIDKGQFTLDGEQYQLELNAPDSQLHGGKYALNKQLWQASISSIDEVTCLSLTYVSPDGEEGFPGEVTFKVNYKLNDKNELIVEYFASTTKTTIVNLTQHSYFNLAGHDSGNIHNHQVTLNADYFLPMTQRAYPTGEIKSVKNTAHDFITPRTLVDSIDSNDPQIQIGLGYDNYWLVNESAMLGEQPIAQAFEPNSGRRMTIYSDQPSVILYTANYIDGSHFGKNNFCYQKRAAFCIEPQRANSHSNGTNICNTVLTPQTPFFSQSRYVFDVV